MKTKRRPVRGGNKEMMVQVRFPQMLFRYVKEMGARLIPPQSANQTVLAIVWNQYNKEKATNENE